MPITLAPGDEFPDRVGEAFGSVDPGTAGVGEADGAAAVHVVTLGDAIGIEGVDARCQPRGIRSRVRCGHHVARSGTAKDLRSENRPTMRSGEAAFDRGASVCQPR